MATINALTFFIFLIKARIGFDTVQESVEILGCIIEVNSIENQRMSFVVNLPLA